MSAWASGQGDWVTFKYSFILKYFVFRKKEVARVVQQLYRVSQLFLGPVNTFLCFFVILSLSDSPSLPPPPPPHIEYFSLDQWFSILLML